MRYPYETFLNSPSIALSMFYKLELKDHIRVPPKYFGLDIKEAVLEAVKLKYDGMIDSDLGITICVNKVNEIGEGVIIPGDGASYFETTFEIITAKPELQEVVTARVRDIGNFGAFMTIGPLEGMIHISQTMDDFVSFSKDKVLSGRESKKSLRVGDICRARIIAVSYKDLSNPKIGLTMRQTGLGKLEWLEEEKKAKKAAPKTEKKAPKAKKK